MIRSLMALGLLLLLTGCARVLSSSTRVATAAAYLCKHCNCFMPADVDQDKVCPVCDCGYLSHACRRGK